jgi:tetratricopeptide (TPR) repeat protein
MIVNSVHNEFLEALTEGGVLRLLLTLGLTTATAAMAMVGYRRFRRRTIGPLLLGAVYGFMAISFHSFFDFGIHIPAVAILAAVIAAHVINTTQHFQDSESQVGEASRRRDHIEPVSCGGSKTTFRIITLRGWTRYGAGVFFVLLGVQLAWTEWRAIVVNRSRIAAARVIETDGGDRWDRAVAYLEMAIRARPTDGELWNELAATHLSALAEKSGFEPVLAAVGGVAIANLPESPLGLDVERHVLPALRAARQARDLSPLLPGPHLRLGEFAEFLIRTEPAEVHFARAQQVGRYDPDVWYLSGVEAFKNRQFDKAWKDWRESLSRSTRRLAPIVQKANRVLTAEQIRDQVLPADPSIWVQSTALLFPFDDPDPERQAAWLRAAMARWGESGDPRLLADWVTWARTHERLREWSSALNVWREAVKRFPDSELIREGLASRLETDEKYGEAIVHIEWLVQRAPQSNALRDRLDAARHGLVLENELARP